MSEEMAVGDIATSEETKLNSSDAVASAGDAATVQPELPSEPPAPVAKETSQNSQCLELTTEIKIEEVKVEEDGIVNESEGEETSTAPDSERAETSKPPDSERSEISKPADSENTESRGVKRRASVAFSEDGDDVVPPEEQFKGFDAKDDQDVSVDYSKVVERLEAEVTAATASFTPLKTVTATPPALRANKRLRADTDGSRPSSALSMKSDGEASLLVETVSSPAARGRRTTTTTEMSSPLLRVPLERGWRRELVYRAALDQHSRRQADIYYYTPHGKKLRSTREIAEHLYGTGLTLENFSFFKEPLGVDDPEKEIIRDAKAIRRVDSPIAAVQAPTEGKRTPKPKPPKGVSPEPVNKNETPAKIKVKSVGSRLSGSGTNAATPTQTATRGLKKPATPSAENNNTAAWKKPRPPPGPQLLPGGAQLLPTTPQPPVVPPPQHQMTSPAPPVTSEAELPPPTQLTPPPPLQSRPQLQATPPEMKPSVSTAQPCSLSCGLGVPTLTCAACLCLYHPKCAGLQYMPPTTERFLCKHCRKSTSPPLEPPPLIHKSGISGGTLPAPVPRRVSAGPPPVPVPVPVPAKVRPDKRVLLRMKVSSGGPDGERVWAVQTTPKSSLPSPTLPTPSTTTTSVPQHPTAPISHPTALSSHTTIPSGHSNAPFGQSLTPLTVTSGRPTTPSSHPIVPVSRPITPSSHPIAPPVHPQPSVHQTVPRPRMSPLPRNLPQSLAIINGRKFIIVPRTMVQPPAQNDTKARGRLANGAASPEVTSPRRRGRSKMDETDYFTAFYNKAQEHGYNVVVQIFQYVGMRELAMCARVCRLWRQLSATPALWRHVRMKNSHVSDWGGLCSALKRHGTKRLDLRKMLLPQNDALFWDQFAKHIGTVDTLERIEMCRCPATTVEAVCRSLPNLRALSALAIRDALLDPTPLGTLRQLHELRLKSMSGLSLTRDLRPLTALISLQHLSLTSIKDLGWCLSDVVGQLEQLETLELGECTFRAEFAQAVGKLKRLRRLRLERGTAQCAAPAILRALASLPALTSLELVNIDVKVGFDDALAECKNIQRLLIIPTYVSQSATTNKQVLSGVLRLKETLTHLMWGVTIELLRVTELFIDQCEQAGEAPRRDLGECIPVLKPVPGCRLPPDHRHVAGPPQVEILPLPTLQRLLSAQLPNTKLKLLRIPFHATWRQSLADFQ